MDDESGEFMVKAELHRFLERHFKDLASLLNYVRKLAC